MESNSNSVYLGLNGQKSMIFEATERHLISKSYGANLKNFQNSKVVVFGHWKAGTVWLHKLLSDIFEVEMITPRFGPPESFFSSGIVKTHELLSPIVKSRGDLLHGVYILRDIRDCMLSMYHFSKTDYYQNVFGQASATFRNIDSFYYDFFYPGMFHNTIGKSCTGIY